MRHCRWQGCQPACCRNNTVVRERPPVGSSVPPMLQTRITPLLRGQAAATCATGRGRSKQRGGRRRWRQRETNRASGPNAICFNRGRTSSRKVGLASVAATPNAAKPMRRAMRAGSQPASGRGRQEEGGGGSGSEWARRLATPCRPRPAAARSPGGLARPAHAGRPPAPRAAPSAPPAAPHCSCPAAPPCGCPAHPGWAGRTRR